MNIAEAKKFYEKLDLSKIGSEELVKHIQEISEITNKFIDEEKFSIINSEELKNWDTIVEMIEKFFPSAIKKEVEIYTPNITQNKIQLEINQKIKNMLDKKGLDRVLYTKEELLSLASYTNEEIPEYKSINEYYVNEFTPDEVVRACWSLAYKYGFKITENKKILENSCGIGNFLRYAPKKCKVKAYETNETFYKIAKLLYPDFEIINDTFESSFYYKKGDNYDLVSVSNEYDLIIGNPPCKKPFDSEYMKKEKQVYPFINSLEEWFIVRSIDSLNKRGLLIYVLPSFCINNTLNDKFKEELFKKCSMIDSYRLPIDAFESKKINYDIIVLIKNK